MAVFHSVQVTPYMECYKRHKNELEHVTAGSFCTEHD